MKFVKLISVADSITADTIIELLMQNQIPAYKKERGAGNYMNVYMGYSVNGEEIYVEEGDFEKADQLIANFREENQTEDDIDWGKVPFYRTRAGVARILIGLAAVSGLLLFYISNLTK